MMQININMKINHNKEKSFHLQLKTPQRPRARHCARKSIDISGEEWLQSTLPQSTLSPISIPTFQTINSQRGHSYHYSLPTNGIRGLLAIKNNSREPFSMPNPNLRLKNIGKIVQLAENTQQQLEEIRSRREQHKLATIIEKRFAICLEPVHINKVTLKTYGELLRKKQLNRHLNKIISELQVNWKKRKIQEHYEAIEKKYQAAATKIQKYFRRRIYLKKTQKEKELFERNIIIVQKYLRGFRERNAFFKPRMLSKIYHNLSSLMTKHREIRNSAASLIWTRYSEYKNLKLQKSLEAQSKAMELKVEINPPVLVVEPLILQTMRAPEYNIFQTRRGTKNSSSFSETWRKNVPLSTKSSKKRSGFSTRKVSPH